MCDQPKQDEQPIDLDRRRFLTKTAGVLGGVGAACALTPFIASWLPNSKDNLTAEPLQVKIDHLKPGEQLIVKWHGKPIWIIRRTQKMLEELNKPNNRLRDPLSLSPQQPHYAQNNYRSRNPEFLVLIGICTHLGCSPGYKPNAKEENKSQAGFLCPCHGSLFDMAGRVFKNMPAPINLAVPPYHFADDKTLIIGKDDVQP
ncbi:MAG: ubiquinol-cytochrome c reductase iron-sulfur subunit [Legionella sp. 40-6]|nr:ubiquinol-cytochrome c reductase iron-sulfur subunit [Legionella sp.]OJY40192.1 MAG: ubiquinol-cytochrome c reductase iron-sulfur subunit [Legionella sp. 40-6]